MRDSKVFFVFNDRLDVDEFSLLSSVVTFALFIFLVLISDGGPHLELKVDTESSSSLSFSNISRRCSEMLVA